MHAVPSTTTKVVTSWCNKNIICKIHLLLQFNNVKLHLPYTLHIWLNMTMMHEHTIKDSIMLNHLTYTSNNNNVKVHLYLHWLAQQQLHYQVFTSTHSTSHNSNKSHHHIIINIIIIATINQHHNNFIQFLTIQVKEKIQRIMINIIFNT